MIRDRRDEVTTWTVTARHPNGGVPVRFFHPGEVRDYAAAQAELGVPVEVREVHEVTTVRLIPLDGVPQGGAR